MFGWLSDLCTFLGFYLIAAYCIVVEFYLDRIRRYDGLYRLDYLLNAIKQSKFVVGSWDRDVIAVVTGACGTIGIEITRLLLQNRFKVICLIRDHERIDWIDKFDCQPDLTVHTVDLANLQEVKKMAKQLADKYPHVDLVICNAAIMLQPYSLTTDGFETHFAVNFLSHAILANYLLPTAGKSAGESLAGDCTWDSRIIFISSATAHLGNFCGMLEDNPELFLTYRNGYQAYSTSKLALSLYATELNERIQEGSATANHRTISAISLHPGCVASGLYKYANFWSKFIIFQFLQPLMRNPTMAAAEIVALACADNLKGGNYYQHMVPTRILGTTRVQQRKLYQYVQNIISNI